MGKKRSRKLKAVYLIHSEVEVISNRTVDDAPLFHHVVNIRVHLESRVHESNHIHRHAIPVPPPHQIFTIFFFFKKKNDGGRDLSSGPSDPTVKKEKPRGERERERVPELLVAVIGIKGPALAVVSGEDGEGDEAEHRLRHSCPHRHPPQRHRLPTPPQDPRHPPRLFPLPLAAAPRVPLVAGPIPVRHDRQRRVAFRRGRQRGGAGGRTRRRRRHRSDID